jgi:hypothetical protein
MSPSDYVTVSFDYSGRHNGLDGFGIMFLPDPVSQIMKKEVVCFGPESIVKSVIETGLLRPEQGKLVGLYQLTLFLLL